MLETRVCNLATFQQETNVSMHVKLKSNAKAVSSSSEATIMRHQEIRNQYALSSAFNVTM